MTKSPEVIPELRIIYNGADFITDCLMSDIEPPLIDTVISVNDISAVLAHKASSAMMLFGRDLSDKYGEDYRLRMSVEADSILFAEMSRGSRILGEYTIQVLNTPAPSLNMHADLLFWVASQPR